MSYYVNEGLGPMYYSSVNSGDHGNVLSLEYDYIPADVSSILMTTNPAYQSTSYPSSTSGAIQDKNFVTNYDTQLQRRPHPKQTNCQVIVLLYGNISDHIPCIYTYL